MTISLNHQPKHTETIIRDIPPDCAFEDTKTDVGIAVTIGSTRGRSCETGRTRTDSKIGIHRACATSQA